MFAICSPVVLKSKPLNRKDKSQEEVGRGLGICAACGAALPHRFGRWTGSDGPPEQGSMYLYLNALLS